MKQAAILWNNLGFSNYIEPLGVMACYGCSPAPCCKYGIRECAMEAQMDNYGRCNKYPCYKIDDIFKWGFQTCEKDEKQVF
ncbi:MAG: DUF3795 domain-containing protein [Dehalococcoidales bacterium]|nr:DUF3795 domain-containing protein [Dehalococcoidales bacterium]